jgi:peptide/nickel transport system permease protein
MWDACVKRFLAVRLLNVVPVVLIITFLVFLLTYLIPGSPAIAILGPHATPAQIAAVSARLGLDKSFIQRYAIWLVQVLHGNLGTSYLSGQSVDSLVAQALPVTLELSFLSLVVAMVIAIPAGIVSAIRKGSIVDRLVTATGFIGISTPSFVLGILLVYLFALTLGWLPATGYVDFTMDPFGNLQSMILPAVTLGAVLSTQFMRYLRAGVLDVLHEDYVTTARAKGVKERTVVLRHVVRNALIPFITVLGLQLGNLLSGVVIIEVVFALPGMGRLALNSLINRDYQVVAGVVLIMAVIFVLINLVVDILYTVLDPRIRPAGAGRAR